MQQLSFFEDVKTETDVARQQFSHDGVCDEAARLDLEERYASLFEETELARFYQSIDQTERYEQILEVAQQNKVLAEINTALSIRKTRGDVNNRGILTMIDQYFAELTFVFAELYRVCRPGAAVVFVNDNVRYAGEVVPVDTLSTNLAEQVGFTPHKIYVLPQRKGNSSQQMGKFGREALRKSITVWKKYQSHPNLGLIYRRISRR